MRTIKVKVYSFNELSEKAKAKAINEFGGDECEYLFDEAMDSINQFAGIFGIVIRRIDFLEPSRSEYYTAFPDHVMDLRGWRLATYVWNNYREGIFRGKYYGKLVDTFKDGTKIPKSKEHPAAMRHVRRKSKVFLSTDCVLTGTCYDMDLLDPIYKFLNNPVKDVSIAGLVGNGINSLCSSVRSEYEYRNSIEGMAESFEANDYEFTENGAIFR